LKTVIYKSKLLDFQNFESLVFDVFLSKTWKKRCFLAGTSYNQSGKINNIILDRKTDEGLCIIDLDTIMPGTILNDFGDMVRTSTAYKNHNLVRAKNQLALLNSVILHETKMEEIIKKHARIL
jgi:predicted nucleotide-binding protein (sugar kinase/HSP70/actin superfamily)